MRSYSGICSSKSGKCAVLLLSLIACNTAQVLAFKRLGYSMGPYPFFLLITISFAFVPVLFIPLAYMRCTSGGFAEGHVSNVWSRVTMMRHFFILGLCNAVNGVLVMFANPYTPGFMQSLLAPLGVPFTVGLSILFLRAKFELTQYAGIALILSGQVFKVTHQSMGGFSAAWAVVFAVGQLPLAMSAVYQEHIFSRANVNVFFMLAWTNLFQFLLLVVLAPLAAVTPGFGDLSLAQLMSEFSRATLCVADRLPGEPCGEAARQMVELVVIMIICMVLQTMTVQAASASVAVVANTIVTPISAFAFTSPLLMGAFAEELDPTAWFSLLLVLVGLACYRWSDLRPASSELTEGFLKPQEQPSRPKILASRVGIVDSEFSNAKNYQSNLLYQHTTEP